MPNYFLIQSRDPFEDRSVDEDYVLARDLAANGDGVTVFLVQNGVLPARRDAQAPRFAELAASRVNVMADVFSLRERAIPVERLHHGVSGGELDTVLDAMTSGDKVIWL